MKKLLYLLLFISVTLCNGCNTEAPEQNNTQSEVEEETTIWKDYIATDHINKKITIGSEESGRITLPSEFQTENLASVFKTDMYYLSLGYTTGVSFVYTKDSPEAIFKQMYSLNLDSPLIYQETTPTREIMQYNVSNDEENAFYSTTCIYHKDLDKTTVINITSLIPMAEEEFKTLALDILKTYDACNLSLKEEPFYEKE